MQKRPEVLPKSTAPVFHDPTEKRWKRVRRSTLVLVAFVTLCIGWFTPKQFSPLSAVTDSQSTEYPRKLLSASDNGTYPVIGDGVFARLDAVQRDTDGRPYLTDPFSGKIIRAATAGEMDVIGNKPYALERLGQLPDKTLALTYDDGPDADHTPMLLDLLSREQVQATFFTIGEQIVKNDDLFRRVINEGHMVGNHTMTHLKFQDKSDWQNRQELITTDQIIRANGYTTQLFRLPYGNENNDPLGMIQAQQLGYLQVGFDWDTRDWEYKPGEHVDMPELDGKGHVVLLHDGGGDHASVVDATQQIIDKARAQGYSFTTLLPVLPEVYQPGPTEPTLANQATLAVFWAWFVLPDAMVQMLTTFGIGSYALMSLLGVSLALINHRRHKKREWNTSPDDLPKVSVVIPAHNEEEVIARTLESLLASDYPRDLLEVIVVDNNSRDGTAQQAKEFTRKHDNVRLIHEFEPGKTHAQNTGIMEANGSIVVMMDADTIFERQTIRTLVRHFDDPQVGAVAGHIKVGNRRLHPRNILAWWQSLEYLSGICVTRMAEGMMNAIMIVPGACSAWRKSAIQEVGGVPEGTLAEDCDLTVMVQRMGYKVAQDNEAVAWTEAPTGVRALAKQRLRWTFGNFQVFHKHRKMVLRPRYGALGMVVMPYAILSILIPLVFTPLVIATAISTIVGGNWRSLAFFAGFIMATHFATSLIAILMVRERPMHLLVVPIYRIVYEPLRTYLLYATLLRALKGTLLGWYSPPRIAQDMGDARLQEAA